MTTDPLGAPSSSSKIRVAYGPAFCALPVSGAHAGGAGAGRHHAVHAVDVHLDAALSQVRADGRQVKELVHQRHVVLDGVDHPHREALVRVHCARRVQVPVGQRGRPVFGLDRGGELGEGWGRKACGGGSTHHSLGELEDARRHRFGRRPCLGVRLGAARPTQHRGAPPLAMLYLTPKSSSGPARRLVGGAARAGRRSRQAHRPGCATQ